MAVWAGGVLADEVEFVLGEVFAVSAAGGDGDDRL